MNKKLIPLVICLSAFLCVKAQKEKGQDVLTLSTSVGLLHPISYNAMYDYSLGPIFSIGGAVNYARFNSHQGNLYRTNIGIRGLFHLGHSVNRDPYLGFRAGVSIWDGSSNSKFSENGLFTFHAGDVLPSIQMIVGTRYLFADWLGLNTELALGSPYFFSIGLSCKLSNMEEGSKLLRENYLAEAPLAEGETVPHSLLQPVQKKNILKVSLTSIVLAPGISYERYIANRFSVEVGGTLNMAGAGGIQSGNSETGVLSENDSTQSKIKAYGMLKYYTSAKRNAIPKGWYTGLSINYISKTTRVHVTDLDSVPSPISFDYEKNQTQIAGGLVVGYQHTFKKHFCLDAFAGFRIGPTHLNYMKYYSADASEEKFLAHFGSHLAQVNSSISPAVLRISFGYMF